LFKRGEDPANSRKAETVISKRKRERMKNTTKKARVVGKA